MTAVDTAAQVDVLAALIREADGKHDLGAAALAEKLVARGVSVDAGMTRARIVDFLRFEYERLWDDGNGAGLDGWVGPGRGAGEVDQEAIRTRERDVNDAVSRLIAQFWREATPRS
ncbi:hypothetical protein ACNQVK_00560 [Mycobacterium sp. 134]|uniref:hypothetical protein n=1 Tax=Mycobacterium sp. 134 TaxID=3400425 RepID=UPI003AAE23F3